MTIRFRHVLEVLGLTLAILALTAGVFGTWYWGGWTGAGDWREAWRHAHTPRMLVDRFIYLRWIHPDAQYWLSHVNFANGPIHLEGRAPDAPYWSMTWYESTHANPSLNDQNTTLDGAGRYRAVLGPDKGDAPNWLEVVEGTGRAVLYLRIYDPKYTHPTHLPTVTQNGEVLAHGGPR